jgi:tetratricopeptide (TPR) repeat protein
MLKKTLFLFFLIAILGCGTATKKVSTSKGSKKHLKDQNSYYYFLTSQLSNVPDSKFDSDSLLEDALLKDQDSSYLWAEKSIREAQKLNWNQSLHDAQKSLEKNPKNFDTLMLIGKIYAAKLQPKKALIYYKRALIIDAKDEELYSIMAREYVSISDHKSAKNALKTCMTRVSEAMSCLYYLATIQMQTNDIDAALRSFYRIYELNPDNPKILQTIADLHIKKTHYSKALKIYDQLKQVTPNDMTHYIRSGLIYYDQKKLDEAIVEFKVVISKYPRSDRINYFLGLLFVEKKQLDIAYTYLDAVDPESNFFKESLNRQLFILRKQGKLKETISVIDQKIKKKDQTADIYGLKASLYLLEDEYQKALGQVNQALAKYKGHAQLLFQRAIIYDKLDQWPRAKKDLKALIVIQPESERVLNFLGYTMIERGDDINEALHFINKALELKPNDGHIIDSLAWAYYNLKDYQKALGLLIKANSLKPGEPAILEHLGDVYFQLKNKRKARQYYEKALNNLYKAEKKSKDELKQTKSIEDKLAGF